MASTALRGWGSAWRSSRPWCHATTGSSRAKAPRVTARRSPSHCRWISSLPVRIDGTRQLSPPELSTAYNFEHLNRRLVRCGAPSEAGDEYLERASRQARGSFYWTPGIHNLLKKKLFDSDSSS